MLRLRDLPTGHMMVKDFDYNSQQILLRLQGDNRGHTIKYERSKYPNFKYYFSVDGTILFGVVDNQIYYYCNDMWCYYCETGKIYDNDFNCECLDDHFSENGNGNSSRPTKDKDNSGISSRKVTQDNILSKLKGAW